MEDSTKFLNNLRKNYAKWEADLNRNAQALNQMRQQINQSWQAGTAPLRELETGVQNAINTTNQNIANGSNTLANNAGSAIMNMVPSISQQPQTSAQPTAQLAASAPAQSNAQQSGQNTYQRDQGIDTFVSILRTMMNPLHGITGDTPLDIVTNSVSDSLYNAFGKKASKGSSGATTAPNTVSDSEATLTSNNNGNTDEADLVSYTYQPGDTFGEVVRKLGLGTDKGLWGNGGDVEYYTQQLISQGALDRNGNIPIGTTIKLRRRK